MSQTTLVSRRDVGKTLAPLMSFVPPPGVDCVVLMRPRPTGVEVQVRLKPTGGEGVVFVVETVPTAETLRGLYAEAIKLLKTTTAHVAGLDASTLGGDQ